MRHRLALLVLLLLAACATQATPPPGTTTGFAELFDQGAGRMLGLAKVATETSSDGATTYEFDPASGPLCLRGAPFRMAVRDTGHADLVVFLQGGGACWSTFCLAIQVAPAGIPEIDILRRDLPANPVRDWNVAYLPYCDGSLFAGDAEHDDDGDGQIDRRHHGLANLTAGLEIAAQRFATPGRVMIAGSSGGGFGTLPAVPLARKLWPDAELLVVQDAGLGLGRPGDPAFLQQLLDEFGTRDLLPASCQACQTSAHLTPLVQWQLERDPNLRVAALAADEDRIMAKVFLKIPGAAFRQALRDATDPLHAAFPDRYRRFLVAGELHTMLLGNVGGLVGDDLGAVTLPKESLADIAGIELGSLETTAIDGVSVGAWLTAMVDGQAAWTDKLQKP